MKSLSFDALLRMVCALCAVLACCGLVAAAEPVAAWRMTGDGPTAEGLALLDGGDGRFTAARRAGHPCATLRPDSQPAAMYLYFGVEGDKPVGGGPVWVEIEYLDDSPGGRITLEYDSRNGDDVPARYAGAEEQWGGVLTGSGKWRRAVYELRAPAFTGRQNLGADFRLGGVHLSVKRATLLTAAPEDREKGAVTSNPARPVQRVRAGAGKRVIIGGFDPGSLTDAANQARALEAVAATMKSVGVTSHEGYVRWNLCEPEPGRYDWSVYDRYVDIYRQHGLKWVPFLICGSAYSLPDWFYRKEGFQGYVCLEHGEESDIASLWSPEMRGHLARFIAAFCEHYRDTGVVDSILLGITGNYGEAIYPASGNDWTASVYGDYHTHGGFWAGDPFAVADLRRFLAGKYAAIADLNAAWGTAHDGFDDIKPFLRDAAPNDRAWLDFTAWYIGAMNDYTRFWLENVRKHWDGPVEVCTGGHAPAEHGADFGMQCRLAAEFGAGVRITNEGTDYRANFSLTRWVASAGHQYGAYFSFEPAGEVRPEGVVPRVYNAAASGARGLHYYHPNVFAQDAALKAWLRGASAFRDRSPRVEIAVYYPETHILLNGNQFLEHIQPLRDRFDFAYLSDGQIADGGLKNCKALVLLWGDTAEKETWNALAGWTQNGGLLVNASGTTALRTVEGDAAAVAPLFAEGADTGKGRACAVPGDPKTPALRQALTDLLRKAPELSKGTRALLAADGEEDRVFATLTGANTLLWLNASGHADKQRGLPDNTIRTTNLRGKHSGR